MALLFEFTHFLEIYWTYFAIVLIVLHFLYNRYGHGLSNVPGPFLASITDVWLFIHYSRRKGLEEYQMHQEYKSPLLRLGPTTVSISDPEAVRVIYGWKPVLKKVSLAERSGGNVPFH